MSEHALTITITDPSAIGDASYWLRIVPEGIDDDTATVGEVADVIDALFDIDPCDPEQDNTGGEEQPVDEETGDAAPPVTEDEFNQVVPSLLELAGCGVDSSGCYEAQVRVYKSHRDEPYKLVVTNGEVLQTIRVEEQAEVQLTVKDAASVYLELPVISGLSTSWIGTVRDSNGACDHPEITLHGSTLHFSKTVTGRIRATFATEYDLVTVKIDGMDDEPQDGSLIAFYHALAFEGTVEMPLVDGDTDPTYCTPTGGTVEVPGSAECYQLVHQLTKCQCSEVEVSRETVEQAVDCPEGTTPGRRLLGSTTVTVARVDCGEVDQDIDDPEFYEQTCCEAPPWPLPKCVRRKTVYRGGKGIDGGVDKYKALYGDNVRLVPVGPDDGVCGETTVEQVKNARSCCDEATPLAWDYDNSAEVIADNSSGIVFVTGGLPPYTVSVRGNGFWLDEAHTIRDGVTDTQSVAIYLDADACGLATVTISDGCTLVSGNVRASLGQWVQIDDLHCGGATGYVGNLVWEMVDGEYRTIQNVDAKHGASCCTLVPGDCPFYSNTPFCLNIQSMIALLTSYDYLGPTGCNGEDTYFVGRHDYTYNLDICYFNYVDCWYSTGAKTYKWTC